jgi:kynurenine formamidase
MKTTIHFNGKEYTADLSKGHDLSIPLVAGEDRVSAWYVPPIRIEPVKMGEWTGSVAAGASVNFRNIFFNPHGHGTHTESYGHISKEIYSVNEVMQKHFFVAQIITVTPIREGEDYIIHKSQIAEQCIAGIEAIILRTMPNGDEKMHRKYSSSNPPYLHHEAASWMCENNIKHLLLDLPSVDREEDGGKLLAHHAFWNYPAAPRKDATITEMIYVREEIKDGLYLLNLQTAPFENDATPSRPVVFGLYL